MHRIIVVGFAGLSGLEAQKYPHIRLSSSEAVTAANATRKAVTRSWSMGHNG